MTHDRRVATGKTPGSDRHTRLHNVTLSKASRSLLRELRVGIPAPGGSEPEQLASRRGLAAGRSVPASGTQTFVTVTAVPEPATLALFAAAAGLAAVARRRR
jgi:hypothetical protein